MDIVKSIENLSIDDKPILIGPNYESDDEFYIIKCFGIDNDKNKYVKLKCKRKKNKSQ